MAICVKKLAILHEIEMVDRVLHPKGISFIEIEPEEQTFRLIQLYTYKEASLPGFKY